MPLRVDPATSRCIQESTKGNDLATNRSPARASQLSKIRRLTNVRPYLLEPDARIGTVHDAAQVAQTFGHIASVIENVSFGGPCIVGKVFEILLLPEF